MRRWLGLVFLPATLCSSVFHLTVGLKHPDSSTTIARAVPQEGDGGSSGALWPTPPLFSAGSQLQRPAAVVAYSFSGDASSPLPVSSASSVSSPILESDDDAAAGMAKIMQNVVTDKVRKALQPLSQQASKRSDGFRKLHRVGESELEFDIEHSRSSFSATKDKTEAVYDELEHVKLQQTTTVIEPTKKVVGKVTRLVKAIRPGKLYDTVKKILHDLKEILTAEMRLSDANAATEKRIKAIRGVGLPKLQKYLDQQAKDTTEVIRTIGGAGEDLLKQASTDLESKLRNSAPEPKAEKKL